MSALVYLIRKSVKNSLRELLRKPAKLIMCLLVIVMLVGVIFISIVVQPQAEAPSPLFWFTLILFAFVAMFVVIMLLRGLSGGDAIFGMQDVNLLFVSPVSPRQTLLYGIARMAKMAFLSGFFILFQSSSLANLGINYGGVLLTFAGFLLSMMVLMVASLLIYSVTNGNARRKLVVKCLTAALFIPLAVLIISKYASTQSIAATVEAAAASPLMRYIPVAGWTASGVTAFLSGEVLEGALFFGLNLLLGAGMMVYILLSNPDYYEDVLVATETAFEKKRAAAEGNLGAATTVKKNVRVTKTGIPGVGASALFGKHMREDFRQNRLGVFTLASALIAAVAIAATYIIRDMSIVLQIMMWMQIMLIGTGRGLKETYSHYIYLIPEASFSKIIWSNMEIMARSFMEAVLVFAIGGVLIGAGIVGIVLCIAVYTLFSFLLLGVNYLSMRFTGSDLSAGIMILLYYLAVVVAMLPGVVAALVLGFMIGGELGYLVGLLVLSAWELFAGFICFALSRGVLHDCDMAMMNQGK